MNGKNFDIDVLKALSIIEGAVRASGNEKLESVVMDQIGWITSAIINGLKENK